MRRRTRNNPFAKIIIIASMIAIFLIPMVTAETLFEGTIKDNEPFYIQGVKHIARYYPSAEKLSLAIGEDRILIKLHECEDYQDRQYCVDKATAGYDDETGQGMSETDIRVLEFGPDVTIDRDISDTTPLIGQEVTVDVTITNKGTERATSINYKDRYPPEVTISGPSINRALNQAEWAGSLDPEKSHTFSYTLKFKDFITYQSKAEVSYPHKDKIVNKYSSSVNFTVQKPYDFSTNLSTGSAGLGEEITYTATIKNEGTENLNSDLNIIVPEGAIVVSRGSDLKGTAPTLTYSSDDVDLLKPGDTKTLEFTFKETKKGLHEIKSKASFKTMSNTFSEEKTDTFTAGVSDIVASVNITPSTVKAGGEFMAEVKVTNRGSKTITVDSIDFESDLTSRRGWRSITLEPGKSHYALNKIMYAPLTNEEQEYLFNISGWYLNSKGMRFDFSKTGMMTIEPFEKILDIKEDHHLINETAGQKYINITVRIKNIKDYELTDLNIVDSIPKGSKQVSGQRDLEREKLEPGEEILAYSYVVRLPKGFEETKFDITHTINVKKEGEEEAFEIPATITLDGVVKEDKENNKTSDTTEERKAAGQTEDNTTTKTTNDEEEKGKKGLLSRLWDWLKNIF